MTREAKGIITERIKGEDLRKDRERSRKTQGSSGVYGLERVREDLKGKRGPNMRRGLDSQGLGGKNIKATL